MFNNRKSELFSIIILAQLSNLSEYRIYYFIFLKYKNIYAEKKLNVLKQC